MACRSSQATGGLSACEDKTSLKNDLIQSASHYHAEARNLMASSIKMAANGEKYLSAEQLNAATLAQKYALNFNGNISDKKYNSKKV